MGDNELVQAAAAGDEPAFDEIMARYKRPVISFVCRLTGNAAAAQDLAQEVFVRAWNGMGRFRPAREGSLAAWLFRIARNLCIDRLRRRGHDPLAAAIDDPAAVDHLSAGARPTQQVEADEIGARVATAVAQLPEDQRTAFILSEYEGLSYADIAAVMKTSIKSVESRLYRAKQTLRADLSDLMG